jgi:hypothetical protein
MKTLTEAMHTTRTAAAMVSNHPVMVGGLSPRREPPLAPGMLLGLSFWFNAQRGNQVMAAGAVSATRDLSGYGYDATQATGSKQPLWVPGAGPRGYDVLRFAYAATSGLTTGAIGDIVTERHIFIVAKMNILDGGIVFRDVGGNNNFQMYTVASNWILYLGGERATGIAADLFWHVFYIRSINAKSVLWVGDKRSPIITVGNPGTMRGLFIGYSSTPATMDFAEMLVFNGEVSVQQVEYLFQWLRRKYQT